MTLSGEGEYNLNSLKKIEVTDSFYELDKEARKCQSYKSNGTYEICTSRYFEEQMILNCGCLAYQLQSTIPQSTIKMWYTYNIYFILFLTLLCIRSPLALLKMRSLALKWL